MPQILTGRIARAAVISTSLHALAGMAIAAIIGAGALAFATQLPTLRLSVLVIAVAAGVGATFGTVVGAPVTWRWLRHVPLARSAAEMMSISGGVASATLLLGIDLRAVLLLSAGGTLAAAAHLRIAYPPADIATTPANER